MPHRTHAIEIELALEFLVGLVPSLRAHYTMDVFTGVVAAVFAMWLASDVAGYLERRRTT
ncbi:MAG: hypothetical protein ACKPEA_16815 [Planctomycetota bacterium]